MLDHARLGYDVDEEALVLGVIGRIGLLPHHALVATSADEELALLCILGGAQTNVVSFPEVYEGEGALIAQHIVVLVYVAPIGAFRRLSFYNDEKWRLVYIIYTVYKLLNASTRFE